MNFRMLGALEIQREGRPVAIGSGKSASLLGVLLLYANEVVSTERLVDELWGDQPPASATRLVHGYVSVLRRQLGHDRIETHPRGYLIRVKADELDLAEFERLVAAGRIAPPAEAARRFREALALWRGPTLADLRLLGPAAQQVQRLGEVRLSVVLDRVEVDLILRRHAHLVDELSQLAAEHTLDERLHGLLMLALYRSGRQAAALEVYRSLSRTLGRELGIDPNGQLQGLHRAILQQDPGLAVVSSPGDAGRTSARPTPNPDTMPSPLLLTPAFPFVGRSTELAALRDLLPREAADGRRIVMMGGEAGSGKSRLVREFAHEAANHGVTILFGACDPLAPAPYRPVTEALAHLVQITDSGTLRDDLGESGGELLRLMPNLPARVSELHQPVLNDPDTARHRLHAAVADLLAAVGRRGPVVLIVEDGHWADSGTLLLLRHLARAAVHARLLVLVTFRDTNADVTVEFDDMLAELRRSDGVVRINVGALTDDEVATFVVAASASPATPADGLVSELRDLTGGNAFLLCELWRMLAESGEVRIASGTVGLTRPLGQLAAPQGVREVVSQRLARLPIATRDLLDVAAVTGTTFDIDVLRRVAPSMVEHIDSLGPAERSGMIAQVRAPRLTYRFSHELVRRAIYDRLTGVARAKLHLRVGQALVEGNGDPSAQMLADLAGHFTSALPFGEPALAAHYNILAARAATSSFAYADAAERLALALQLCAHDERVRGALLLELGEASLRAGRSLDALNAFRKAADAGRTIGDGELFARAAIGFEDAGNRPRLVDTGAVEMLREALTSHIEGDSFLRVRLLAGLARALNVMGDYAGTVVVRTNAIEMARRIDDWQGLATALLHASWARGSDSPQAIVAMATESCDIAARIGEVEIQAEASALRVAALTATGDMDAARRQLAEATNLATRTQQPFLTHIVEMHTSALALLEGRLDDAETAAEQAYSWGRLLTGADSSTDYSIQMFGVRREQGRLAEVAPIVRRLIPPDRPVDVWRAAFAAVLSELGMTEEVRRELASIRDEGLDAVPRTLWTASLAYLAEACAFVGDQRVAQLLYPQLEPYSGTNLMVGYCVAYYGAADRYLGMLAATMGDVSTASRHFDAALEFNQQMGATTWTAHTCYQYGRLLRVSGQSDRAETLFARASALAVEIGMSALLDRIRAIDTTPPASHQLPGGLSKREAEVLRLVAQGLSNRQIGETLAVSEHTIAIHVRSILRKTRSANRTDAASFAHRHGLTGS